MGAFEDELNRLRATPSTPQELLHQIAHLLRSSNPMLNIDMYHVDYGKDIERYLVGKIEAYSAAIADRVLADRDAAAWHSPVYRTPDDNTLVCVAILAKGRVYNRIGYFDNMSDTWLSYDQYRGCFVPVEEKYSTILKWREHPTYTRLLEN